MFEKICLGFALVLVFMLLVPVLARVLEGAIDFLLEILGVESGQ